MVRQLDPTAIVYPESDGKPLADNTLQFRIIVTLHGGIDLLFKDRADVFVAGDLFWYPVEGQPEIVQAPDVMVAFGRPKGDRRSYLQWQEGGIAPQVVFEIASRSNSLKELERKKLNFYDRYGVEEYYVHDPDRGTLKGWLRSGEGLAAIATMSGWVSPRLGVRFELEGKELQVYRPDGEPFATYIEVADRAHKERQRAERESQRADRAEANLAALLEQLRNKGIDPNELGLS